MARAVLRIAALALISCRSAPPQPPPIAHTAATWSRACAAMLDASVRVGPGGTDELAGVDDRLRDCWRAAIAVVERADRGVRDVLFPSCRALDAARDAPGFPARAASREWFVTCRRLEASTPEVVALTGRPRIPAPVEPPEDLRRRARQLPTAVPIALVADRRLRPTGDEPGVPVTPHGPWDLAPAARVLCATLHDVTARFGARVEIPLATVEVTAEAWIATWPAGSTVQPLADALSRCRATWTPSGFAIVLESSPPRLVVRRP